MKFKADASMSLYHYNSANHATAPRGQLNEPVSAGAYTISGERWQLINEFPYGGDFSQHVNSTHKDEYPRGTHVIQYPESDDTPLVSPGGGILNNDVVTSVNIDGGLGPHNQWLVDDFTSETFSRAQQIDGIYHSLKDTHVGITGGRHAVNDGGVTEAYMAAAGTDSDSIDDYSNRKTMYGGDTAIKSNYCYIFYIRHFPLLAPRNPG